MVLTIDKYPIIDGALTISCDVSVRQIQQDKVGNIYTLSGIATFKHNGSFVDRLLIQLESAVPFLNSWDKIYEEVKTQLTAKGIKYNDGGKR